MIKQPTDPKKRGRPNHEKRPKEPQKRGMKPKPNNEPVERRPRGRPRIYREGTTEMPDRLGLL